MLQLSTECIPSHVTDRLKDPNGKHPTIKEMQAFDKNGTWKTVDVPIGNMP